jgi:hypothetical protein
LLGLRNLERTPHCSISSQQFHCTSRLCAGGCTPALMVGVGEVPEVGEADAAVTKAATSFEQWEGFMRAIDHSHGSKRSI